MRFIVTTSILALAASFHLFAPSITFEQLRSIESVDDAFQLLQGPPDDATVALEARCGGMQDPRRQTCEESLTARFSSGQTSPASLIRVHCTRVESVWDVPLPEPPVLCVERFGGWLTG
jgi:hypothetical protein